jgi:hypothetical protein
LSRELLEQGSPSDAAEFANEARTILALQPSVRVGEPEDSDLEELFGKMLSVNRGLRWQTSRDAYLDAMRLHWPRHLRTLDALWLNPSEPNAPHERALEAFLTSADQSAMMLLADVVRASARRLEA